MIKRNLFAVFMMIAIADKSAYAYYVCNMKYTSCVPFETAEEIKKNGKNCALYNDSMIEKLTNKDVGVGVSITKFRCKVHMFPLLDNGQCNNKIPVHITQKDDKGKVTTDFNKTYKKDNQPKIKDCYTKSDSSCHIQRLSDFHIQCDGTAEGNDCPRFDELVGTDGKKIDMNEIIESIVNNVNNYNMDVVPKYVR